jgi:hypothetical protein
VGYIEVREAYWHGTVGHEFFINLTMNGTGTGLSRQQLVQLADAELRALDDPTWAQE